MEQNNQVDKEFSLNIKNTEDEGDKKIMWFSFVVLILALVAIAVFVFKYNEVYKIKEEKINTEKESDDLIGIEKRLPEKMKGKIYLTLAPKNDSDDSLGIFSYNLKKENLEEFLLNKGEQLRGGEVVQFTIGDYISLSNGESIFINSVENSNINSWTTLLEDGISNFKSETVWSNGGWKLFYNIIKDKSLDLNTPNNWQIYSLNTTDIEREGKYLLTLQQ
ncbi:hypothetical protein KKH36_03635 [Patescibacteria group bacterium]|nr:hypothetical protein [Patescibacteria group bacterium]